MIGDKISVIKAMGAQIKCDMELESAGNGRTGLGLGVQQLEYRGIDKNSGAEIILTIMENYSDKPQIPSEMDITFDAIIKTKMENTKKSSTDFLDARRQAINHAYHLIKDLLKDEASAENLRKQFPEFESKRKSLNVNIEHDDYKFKIDSNWIETALNEYGYLMKLNFKVSEISETRLATPWTVQDLLDLGFHKVDGVLVYYKLDKETVWYDLVYRDDGKGIHLRSCNCNYVPLKFRTKSQIKNFIESFK